jgi:hypothetical protein
MYDNYTYQETTAAAAAATAAAAAASSMCSNVEADALVLQCVAAVEIKRHTWHCAHIRCCSVKSCYQEDASLAATHITRVFRYKGQRLL